MLHGLAALDLRLNPSNEPEISDSRQQQRSRESVSRPIPDVFEQGSSTPASADADFERILRVRWKQHLDQAPPEIATTKGWRSHYWKAWLEGLDLYDDADDGFEVAVAIDSDGFVDDELICEVCEDHVEGDVIDEIAAGEDTDLQIPTSESGTCLPPPDDEDRHAGPALEHQIQQGA